ELRERPDDDEQARADDQEVDDLGHKGSVLHDAGSDFHREVTKVGLAEDRTDDRLDDVVHERVDDGLERRADDDRDRQVEDIALHDEFPELAEELPHPDLLAPPFRGRSYGGRARPAPFLTMKVRLGVGAGGTSESPESLAELVDSIDELGFDSIWLSEV